MVKTVKTWETIFFHATRKGHPEEGIVELSYNHQSSNHTLCTHHEENVSFKNDTIIMSELKLEALTVAIKYLKTIKK